MRGFLIRLLGGHLAPPDHAEPQHDIGALTARVSALEDLQLKRELEWADVSERVLRYLKRTASIEQRMKDQQESSAGADPVSIALLRSKYPHANGG
jgi:hypothetical protein